MHFLCNVNDSNKEKSSILFLEDVKKPFFLLEDVTVFFFWMTLKTGFFLLDDANFCRENSSILETYFFDIS